MALSAHPLPRDLRFVPNTLPDDTEDTIVGIKWHQEAGGALASVLAAVAERRGASWGVCEEVGLAGLLHLDGRPYSPRPDVFVLAGPVDGRAAEVALAEVGPPPLVVEIASESTWRNDVGDKRAAYAGAGVAEYVVFDPAGDYLAEGVRAWRRDMGGRFVSWEAVDGVWESAALELDLFVEGALLRVRDRDGWTPSPSRRAPLGELEAQTRAAAAEGQARQAEEQARQEAVARLEAEERQRLAEDEVRRLTARLQAMDDDAARRARLELGDDAGSAKG